MKFARKMTIKEIRLTPQERIRSWEEDQATWIIISWVLTVSCYMLLFGSIVWALDRAFRSMGF